MARRKAKPKFLNKKKPPLLHPAVSVLGLNVIAKLVADLLSRLIWH